MRPAILKRQTSISKKGQGPSFRTKRNNSDSMVKTLKSDSMYNLEMTLKDRQEAMNKSHPFGLPIWKPALYKKSRSIVRRANRALHASPSSEHFINVGNLIWLLTFGWWLCLIVGLLSTVLIWSDTYGRVLRELSFYLLWPFGRYVERKLHEPLIDITAVLDEESEEIGLMTNRRVRDGHHSVMRNLPKIIRSGPAAWIYYTLFYIVIAPILFLVSAICWMFVVSIPMSKLTYDLMYHLHQHPLTLGFKSTGSLSPSAANTVILLCTYQAIGLQYYKYTFDGVNIMFINLLPIVFFVILDDWYLTDRLPDGSLMTSPGVIFGLSLASVIPLSYFIGMGVSSISAQSSMGVGAVINATFGSVIEIILYGVALVGGKSALVEGALVGSFLAGVLLMPGFSMVSGALKQKEQRFNAKSAGVTTTMLIMSIIGILAPTLFYQMFGSFELKCDGCPDDTNNGVMTCSRCYYDQPNPFEDPVYQNSVKPFMLLCAAILPSAYIVGLVFSLHTHVDMVWKKNSHTDPPPSPQKTASYYQKLIPTHILSQLTQHLNNKPDQEDKASQPSYGTITNNPDQSQTNLSSSSAEPTQLTFIQPDPVPENLSEEDEEEGTGHDSPNWSKNKSFVILFSCTLLYSLVAEILVNTVDDVMQDFPMDEKFLGLTLFALVPNITEFMNAISFALYGNIVLSMEIGSAYALQVCLLQIPTMVGFSVWYNYGRQELARFTFSLLFPGWDVISIIFSVFLLTYTYQEGKANYFKGSILILSYIVLVAGFYFIPIKA